MNVSPTPQPDHVATLRRLNDSLERTAEALDLGLISREVVAAEVADLVRKLELIKERMQCS